MNNKNQDTRIWPIVKPVVIYYVISLAAAVFCSELSLVMSLGSYKAGLGFDGLLEAYSKLDLSRGMIAFRVMLFSAVALPIFIMWYKKVILSPAKLKIADIFKMHNKYNYKLIIGVILLVAGMSFICLYILDFVSSYSPEAYAEYIDSGKTFYNLKPNVPGVFLAIYVVVCAPILEELVFRGITFGMCEKRMKFWTANILVAVLSGLIAEGLIQSIVTALFSLCMGYIYFQTENILVPIICHMLYNLVGVIDFIETPSSNMAIYFVVFMLSGAAIYAGLWLCNRSSKTICKKD